MVHIVLLYCEHSLVMFSQLYYIIVRLKLQMTIYIYCTIESTDVSVIFAVLEVLMYVDLGRAGRVLLDVHCGRPLDVSWTTHIWDIYM